MTNCKNCDIELKDIRKDAIFCCPNCRSNNWAKHNLSKYYNKILVCKKCKIKYIPHPTFVNYKYCVDCKGTIRYKIEHKKSLINLKKYRDSSNGKLKRTFLQLLRQRKIRDLKESFTYEEWDLKVKNTFGICSGCNKYVGINKLTKDHIVPITKASKGFIYTIDDVQPLCIGCNSSKGNKLKEVNEIVKVFVGTKNEFYMDGVHEENLRTAKKIIKQDWDN